MVTILRKSASPFMMVVATVCLGGLALILARWPENTSLFDPLWGRAEANEIVFFCIWGLMGLNLSVLILKSRSLSFSPASSLEIFNQKNYIDQDLQHTISGLLNNIKAHARSTAAHSHSLTQTSLELQKPMTLAAIHRTIAYLVSENNKINEHSTRVQENLTKAEQKIISLQNKLISVAEEGLRDAVTGLWNRRAFDQKLEEEIHAAKNRGLPLALVLADVDFFKKINDSYGHPVGDEVLRIVGELMSKNVKGRDNVVRFGGEEFALILPHTNLANAVTLAEQIRLEIEKQRWVVKENQQDLGKITVSFGVAVLERDETAPQFITRADQHLYAAKKKGRNQVMSAAC